MSPRSEGMSPVLETPINPNLLVIGAHDFIYRTIRTIRGPVNGEFNLYAQALLNSYTNNDPRIVRETRKGTVTIPTKTCIYTINYNPLTPAWEELTVTRYKLVDFSAERFYLFSGIGHVSSRSRTGTIEYSKAVPGNKPVTYKDSQEAVREGAPLLRDFIRKARPDIKHAIYEDIVAYLTS